MKKWTRLLWALAALCLLVSPACSKKEATQTTQTDPNWERVLSFDDDPLIESIQSLAVFKDQLYAAAADWYEGGTVWRSKDGSRWQRVSQPGFGTQTNYMVAYLYPYQDKLYAGTGCPEWHNYSEDNCGVSMIYRSEDGKKWEAVDTTGFGDQDNQYVPIFAEFQGKLYAGTYNPKGSQIWRSQTGDPDSWEKVVTSSTNNDSVGLVFFKDQLYAIFGTLGMTTPLSIWHTADGVSWEQEELSGNTCSFPGGFAVFQDALYVGVLKCDSGGETWWTADGKEWKVAGPNGSQVDLLTALGVYHENLVAMGLDLTTGAEVWESATPRSFWKQVSLDAFGTNHSTWATWPTKGIAVFKDRLYLGTWGRGEIYRSSFPSQ